MTSIAFDGSGRYMEDTRQIASIPIERIEAKILLIRGKKVMMDRDLATLYGVSTTTLNQAVRRNIARFPEDFMFRLNVEEFRSLRSQIVTSSLISQIVTSKTKRGGVRKLPFAFTEQGVAMLSSVFGASGRYS